jgi:hypothetical protein
LWVAAHAGAEQDLISVVCVCAFFFFHLVSFFFVSSAAAWRRFTAQRVVDAGTEQQGRPSLRRALAWPWPLACKVCSGALGGRRKGAAPRSSAEEQTAHAIGAYA